MLCILVVIVVAIGCAVLLVFALFFAFFNFFLKKIQASFALLNKIDSVLDDFLQKFEKHLANTVVVLISDHGVHFGQLAQTSLVHVSGKEREKEGRKKPLK